MTGNKLFAAAALLLAQLPANAREATDPLLRAPDHVLVWSQRAGAAERLFEGLGFVVRPGQVYPEGITASTIVFGDWSYLEIMHFSDPAKATGNAQAAAELAFVTEGGGANSFAIEVSDVDAAAEFLKRRGFALGEIAPDMVDPDGPEGPEAPQAASWRDFHFAEASVSGAEVFFIEYPPEEPASEEAQERFRARTAHPNGASRLSAIWVVVTDLEKEANAYRRMGFELERTAQVVHLNAPTRVAKLGTGAVILAQPTSLPAEFDLPGRPGPRVIGLSFEVADLAPTLEVLKGGSHERLQNVAGPIGSGVLVNTTDSLGFFVEFHEAPRKIAP